MKENLLQWGLYYWEAELLFLSAIGDKSVLKITTASYNIGV